MKLLILVEWYQPIGGIEAFVWRLVKNLDPEIQITLAVCLVGSKFTLNSTQANLEIVDVTHQTFNKVQRLVKQKSPDVIHINNISLIGFSGIWAGHKLGTAIVLTHHQVPEYKASRLGKFSNSVIWHYIQLLDKYAAVITAPSQTVAQLLNRHGIHQKVKVISCGVNTDLFKPRDKISVRQQLGIKNIPTLLFVGRIAKDKNIELLVKAVGLLKQKFDFQVLIIGPKVVRNDADLEIKRLITRLDLQDLIKQIGYLPTDSLQLALYYAASDIFVIPSFFETQSIVTLEALASGMPIVGSRSGALPELIENGVNGLLFNPLDASDLAKKLGILLKSIGQEAITMGTESRLKAIPHDIKKTASMFEVTYREAMGV